MAIVATTVGWMISLPLAGPRARRGLEPEKPFATAPANRPPDPPARSLGPENGANAFGVSARQMLENYKNYAVYPPASRPVTQERANAFKYNHRVTEYLPVKAKGQPKPAFYAAFTADKGLVFGKDRLTITLRAAQDPEGRRGMPLDIANAGISKGRSLDAVKIGELSFHDDGRDGDTVRGDFTYTATVDPANTAALSDFHGSIRAFVEYTVNGLPFGQQLFFDYYPERAIAGTFTGRFREAIEDGSLVVYAEMNVVQPGYFSVDATLLTSEDRAFCHARFKGALETGMQQVPLQFFGKVIRDAIPPATSPFKVSEIYGQMVPAPGQLLETAKDGSFSPAAVPLYGGTYITNPYRLDDFSDAEWTAPEKTAEMNVFQKLAENQGRRQR